MESFTILAFTGEISLLWKLISLRTEMLQVCTLLPKSRKIANICSDPLFLCMHTWQRWCIGWMTFWIFRFGILFHLWISSRVTNTGDDGTLLRTRQTNASETCSVGDQPWITFCYICVLKFCLQELFSQTSCMSRCIVMLRCPTGRCLRRCLHMEGTPKCLKTLFLYPTALTFQLRICIGAGDITLVFFPGFQLTTGKKGRFLYVFDRAWSQPAKMLAERPGPTSGMGI